MALVEPPSDVKYTRGWLLTVSSISVQPMRALAGPTLGSWRRGPLPIMMQRSSQAGMLSQLRMATDSNSSVGNTTSLAVLARELQVRMTYTVVSSECIRAAEGFLLGANIASYLLLPAIVNCILVACKIVRT